MTFIEICPDCQNPVKVYESGDGTARGKCLCGRTIAIDRTGHRDGTSIPDGATRTIKFPLDSWYYGFIHKGKALRACGAYETLLEAERACTDYAKKGERCHVEQMHEIVSEWTDGERDDLKRKFVKVWFTYTTHEGQRADGSSTIITTQEEPTYKAIEYYLLKNEFTVTRYQATDDDGRILEEKAVQ